MDRITAIRGTNGPIVAYSFKEELEHGLYVSRLARATALEMGFTPAFIEFVALTGILHDIGKLRVAQDLKKDLEQHTRLPIPGTDMTGIKNDKAPGSRILVTEELQYVRTHARHSYLILKEAGFSDDILEAVLHHHENYDGTGYPGSFRGDQIPICSRIIRVCDVYAALTTDRPYRSRFTSDEAILMMIDEITHFDMKVFLAFQRVIHADGGIEPIHLPDAYFEEPYDTGEA